MRKRSGWTPPPPLPSETGRPSGWRRRVGGGPVATRASGTADGRPSLAPSGSACRKDVDAAGCPSERHDRRPVKKLPGRCARGRENTKRARLFSSDGAPVEEGLGYDGGRDPSNYATELV